MDYIEPKKLSRLMVDAGEDKMHYSVKDTLIRAFMAGAILALAAIFAIVVAMKSGSPLLGVNFTPTFPPISL